MALLKRREQVNSWRADGVVRRQGDYVYQRHLSDLANDTWSEIEQLDTNVTTLQSDVATLQAPAVKTAISSAQILALNTTPIDLVAAPSAGSVIALKNVMFSYTFDTAAYATNTNLQLIYDTGVAVTVDANIIAQTGDTIRYIDFLSVEPVVASKLSIQVATGNPTAGGGTLDVYLWYDILTL